MASERPAVGRVNFGDKEFVGHFGSDQPRFIGRAATS
jgi:hypothetical protein